jgi:hypothetical protein
MVSFVGTLARRVTRWGKTVRVASCGFDHALDHYDGAGRNLSVNGFPFLDVRDLQTVRRDLLGHEPKDITDDYTHSTIEIRRRAVNLLRQTLTQEVAKMTPKFGRSPARG